MSVLDLFKFKNQPQQPQIQTIDVENHNLLKSLNDKFDKLLSYIKSKPVIQEPYRNTEIVEVPLVQEIKPPITPEYVKYINPKTEESELRELVLVLFEKYKNLHPSWPKKHHPFLTIRDTICESFSVELSKNEARKILFRTLSDIPASKVKEYFHMGCPIYQEFLLEKDETKNINISKILEQAKNRSDQITDIGYLNAIKSPAMGKIKNAQKAKDVYCAMYEYKKSKNLKNEFNISLQDIKYWLESKNIHTCNETISKLIRCLHDNGLIDKVLPRKYRPPEEGYCISAMYRFSERWKHYNTDKFDVIKFPVDSLKKHHDKIKKDKIVETDTTVKLDVPTQPIKAEYVYTPSIEVSESDNNFIEFICYYLKNSAYAIESLKSDNGKQIKLSELFKDCKNYYINILGITPLKYNPFREEFRKIFPSVKTLLVKNKTEESNEKFQYYEFPYVVTMRKSVHDYLKKSVDWEKY